MTPHYLSVLHRRTAMQEGRRGRMTASTSLLFCLGSLLIGEALPVSEYSALGITRKRGSSAALQSGRLEDGDLSQDFCEVDLRNHRVNSAYDVEIDGVVLQPSPSDAEIFVEILHRDREIKNKRQTPVEPCC